MTHYVVTDRHAPDECKQSWKDWLRLTEDHPDLDLVGGGAYCGCPHGDHAGFYILPDAKQAQTVVDYHSVGTAEIRPLDFVPFKGS